VRLNLGSGPHYAPGWLNVDLYAEDADLKVDLFDLGEHLPGRSATQVYAGHVLEHLPWERIPDALRLVKAIMEPGAELVVVGPCIRMAVATRQPMHIIDAILCDPRDPHTGLGHAWTPTAELTLDAVRSVFPEATLSNVATVTKPTWPNPDTAPWQCAVRARR
jgi:hypothetical protein